MNQTKPVAQIHMMLMSDGGLRVQAESPNPWVAFQMLGQAAIQLGAEYAKQEQQKIQVAPPGFQLPKLVEAQ